MEQQNKSFTKEPLLFLHGYLADSKSFSYQVDELKKYFELYFLDLQGFGENREMPYPYSLDDYINQVKSYLDSKNLKKINVIAHSFGGRIAIKMATIYPQYFNKIVLTGSAGLKPKRTIKYRIKKLCFNFLKLFIKKERLTRLYSKDYNRLSPVMKVSFNKIVNEHLDDICGRIQNQTLIIFGKNDRETPPYMAKRLHAKIKNSKLLFIDNASHFCFIDKPFEFNREVKEFLLSK